MKFLDYRESMRRVIDFIEDNLCGALTMEQLAEVAGYSKYHFVRIFMEETGFTPADYIRKRRLSEIAGRLDGHTGTIAELAFAYGFNSKENFLRAFKAEHKVLPTEYRRVQNSLRLYPKFDVEKWAAEEERGMVPEGEGIADRRNATEDEDAAGRKNAVESEDVADRKNVAESEDVVDGKNVVNGENTTEEKNTAGGKSASGRRTFMPKPKLLELPPFSLTVFESDEAFPPHFWNKYNCKGYSMRLSGGKTVPDYGVSDWDCETNTLRYYIGIRTEDAHGDTAGTKMLSVAGGLYAVFATEPARHFDFVDTIQRTWEYINTQWLVESGYVRTGGYEFETYVETSRTYSEEIYIPVRREG